MRKIDEVGNVYGGLVVLAEDGVTEYRKVKWSCLCECGRVVSVTGDNLRRGITKSCGCLHKFAVKQALSKYPLMDSKHRAMYRERLRRLSKEYGLSEEQYVNMLDKQKGCCAICGLSLDRFNNDGAVDHNHKTGEVRGLLCRHCNTGIGLLQDSADVLISAVNYLNKNKGVEYGKD